ncbi:hypothetical protein [Caproicibacter sp.]|uniref:hypothetical protein n=1 Tax=Caproicibacter sp. TaxID=2814884 RepID=UPI0039891CDE
MSNMIISQHPLAFLEISVFDGCYTIVSSKDKKVIEPLYLMHGDAYDEEASNQRMNAELRRIQDMLRAMVPDVLPEKGPAMCLTRNFARLKSGMNI